MKNKISIRNCITLLSIFYLIPFTGLAQAKKKSSSTSTVIATNALNNVVVVSAPVEQPYSAPSIPGTGVDPSLIIQPAASDQQAILNTTGVGPGSDVVALYGYYLYLNYSVPYYVYRDWQHVHSNAANLMGNFLVYQSESLISLATTDFQSYSEYISQQKLEFRVGSRTPVWYGGDFPPVITNYNLPIKTVLFSGN